MTDARTPDNLDPDIAARLRALSRAEAAATVPWPGVDQAVRRGRRRRVAAGGAVALVCAAAAWLLVPLATQPVGAPQPPAADPSSVSTSAAAPEPTSPSVADYFDPPQPFPGPTWTRYGEPVDDQINSIAGPDHCKWQSAVMMHLGWPLGTVSQTALQSRQFIRDPEGVISVDLQGQLRAGPLPADAEDTGYRLDGLELWLSASDPNGAYLRSGTDVERWPLADPFFACD